MRKLTYAGGLAAALLAGAAPAAKAQSIFHCNGDGSGQTQGAVIGGVLGGLAGVGVAHNDLVGGVLGAAAGAAAGSWIGCKLEGDERVSLDQATRRALDDGRGTTWTNPRTGVTAKIDVYADTTGYGPAPLRYGDPMSPDQVRLGVRVSAADGYETVAPRYTAITDTFVRVAPDLRAPSAGEVLRGDPLEAMAKVRGAPWLLVGRDGVGLGYVPISTVEPVVESVTSASAAGADIPLDSIQLGANVGWAAAYEPAPRSFTAVREVAVRANPTFDSDTLGTVYRGDRIQALARVRGSRWILVGRDGYGVGYVSEDALSPSEPVLTQAAGECRIVEQTITRGYSSDTQRYRACRDGAGGWRMNAL